MPVSQVLPQTMRPLMQPVDDPRNADTRPTTGMGLCLSGGGYRAMVFHIGSIWRLNEAGLISRLSRISSVSGGSITSAVLGMNWNDLAFGPTGVITAGTFCRWFVEPLRAMARQTIDESSILVGLLMPGSISDMVVSAYDKHLFHGKTLQDLPDDTDPASARPAFIINATNVQTGSLWRFRRKYMGDYQIGLIPNPDVTLAKAVGASSAFPPVLSPATLEVDPTRFDPSTYGPCFANPFNEDVVLSDGGVYDNLGLEQIWKKVKTVLVSDAGMKLQPEKDPKRDWAQHSIHVLDLIDNQVRSLRKRQLVASYIAGEREGTYWSVRSRFDDYARAAPTPLPDPLGLKGRCPDVVANTPTRLKRLPEDLQQKLINWGYAICDTALRRHCPTLPGVALPKGLPYPQSGL